MNLEKFLKDVVQHLEKENIQFALAGGLVASLYRAEKRLTNDLDFLLFSKAHTQAQAEKIIKHFKLTPHAITKAQLEGGPMFAIKRKSTPTFMIVGRGEEKDDQIGLDFILPTMPWFAKAMLRAKLNCIDFGFAKIPCLTVEDVIIAKIYAAQNPVRFKDLDDLQSIFAAQHALDLDYLVGELKKYDLTLSQALQSILPMPLRLALKG